MCQARLRNINIRFGEKKHWWGVLLLLFLFFFSFCAILKLV